jgi:NAD(P)H-dependent flavin oxidoreductase YrpB (nitropropane dioxygenase family)
MARFDFVFMLTRDDQTVPDAAAHVATALAAGVRHIGFKDVGLPLAALAELHALIHAGGATSYLEVVSLDRASEIASAEAAVTLGVDHLLGGTRVVDVAPRVAGSGVRYLPFAGRISGHPSVLEGSIDEIVADARRAAAHPGVHGLDLLAWRSRTDAPRLVREVCTAAGKPVIVAGSIDSPERVADARAAGAAGFTVGTAAFGGRFPAPGRDLASQLAAILRAADAPAGQAG